MAFSKIPAPPTDHPLGRNFKIQSDENVKVSCLAENDTKAESASHNVSQNKSVVLALDNKPANPTFKTKTAEQEEKDKQERIRRTKEQERVRKEAIAKTIIDEVDDSFEHKDIDDLELLDMKFELTYIPSEDGTNIRTYIQNYKDFEALTNNDFKLVIIFMSQVLKTSYGSTQMGDDKSWYIDGEWTSEIIEDIKFKYIDEVLRCWKCHFFCSLISKNKNEELIRICYSENCNWSDIIGYSKSDSEDENTSKQLMMSEMLKCVDEHVPITIVYQKLPIQEPEKIDEKTVKQMEYMEKIIKGDVKPNIHSFGRTHYGYGPTQRYANQYPTYGISNAFNKFNAGKTFHTGMGRGNRPHNHQPYVPTISTNTGIGTPASGGYSVLSNPGFQSSVPVSNGYAQNISEAQKTFDMKPVNDGREFYVYMNTKQDRFQTYLRFLIKLLDKIKEYDAKNPFNNKHNKDDHWELSPSRLLRKAKELDIMDSAVLANVMYLFDENILANKQLVNKRKYLLPFINNDSSATGLSFLTGIEYITENDQDALLPQIDEIMTVAFQLKYFDLDTYDKWYMKSNDAIISPAFATRIRSMLKNWRSGASEDDEHSDLSSGYGADTDEEHEHVVFDADLFGNMCNNELEEFDNVINGSLPTYTESQKDYSVVPNRQIAVEEYDYEPKTFTLDNNDNDYMTLS